MTMRLFVWKLVWFMNFYVFSWKKALKYAPMSNDRADRMVSTLNEATKNMVLGKGSE